MKQTRALDGIGRRAVVKRRIIVNSSRWIIWLIYIKNQHVVKWRIGGSEGWSSGKWELDMQWGTDTGVKNGEEGKVRVGDYSSIQKAGNTSYMGKWQQKKGDGRGITARTLSPSTPTWPCLFLSYPNTSLLSLLNVFFYFPVFLNFPLSQLSLLLLYFTEDSQADNNKARLRLRPAIEVLDRSPVVLLITQWLDEK